MPVYKTKSGRYKVENTKGAGFTTKAAAQAQLRAIKANQRRKGRS